MEPFVEQLKRLCREHPTRAKWVFVPSHAIGRTLGDRLVLEGTDWANLRFVTPFDIARRMGGPFLVERGIDPSEEGLGPALIMSLLLRLPDARTYFRPLADQPEMSRALWSTVSELRMAGVRADQIPSDAFASPDKHAELCALLAAYESYLKDTNRGDRGTAFEEALNHPEWCPIQPQDCWTEIPDTIWPSLARRLMDSMPGERIAPAAFELRGAAMPRRLAAVPVTRLIPEATAPLAFLMAPGELGPLDPAAPAGPSNRTFELFQAGGAEAEIEEVLRRILRSGLPLDQVEIACASADYGALIWEKACRHNWPVTLADGVPVSLTRPARALLGFLAWIENDFSAGSLRRLLQSDDVRLGGIDPEVLSSAHAARLLAKSKPAWGRRTYALALGKLAKGYRSYAMRDELGDDDRVAVLAKADQADRLLGWIRALIDAVPESDADGRLALTSLVDCALTFVREHSSTANALDGAAVSTLTNAISQLTALGDFTCSIADGLRIIRESVSHSHVGAGRPIPGHLYVSQLSHAAFASRRLLFVVGVQEGRVFPAAFEDPVLLDAERASISPALRQSGDRIDEVVFRVLCRLAAASASPDTHICLSFSCRDLREYRHTHPSWLMLQAHRVATGRVADGYSDLEKALGAPKSCVPAEPSDAIDASGWWLNGVTRASTTGRAGVLRDFPTLAAGITAHEARESDQFTEYDGYVPAAGQALDPCTNDTAVSATQLEAAAACPFRHFVERGLGVRALEDNDRDTDLWIDPATRGSMLHDLYALMMRKCRDERRRPKLPADRAWLREAGLEALKALNDGMPAPSVEVYERERDGFLADLDLFVVEEAEGADGDARTPIGFEVGFGKGADSAEPLAQAEPVVIDLGGGLKFRLAGRIDRIDQIGPSSFEVIDYKTGGFWPDKYGQTFTGGTVLQHALYGLAATELLRRKFRGATVERGVYYHPSTKGRQERVPIEAPSQADTTAMLADLRGVIAKGLFLHAADKNSCRFCELGPACDADQAVGRAKNKMEHDAALQPYVTVTEHD